MLPRIADGKQVRAVDVRCKRGEVWTLGEHTLVVGDSQSEVFKAFRDASGFKAGTTIYDPPYDLKGLVPDILGDTHLVFTNGNHFSTALATFGIPAWLFVWDTMIPAFTQGRPLMHCKQCLWYGHVRAFNPKGAFSGTAPKGKRRIRATGFGNIAEYIPNEQGEQLTDLYRTSIKADLLEEERHAHWKPLPWIRMLLADCTEGDVFDPFVGAGTAILAAELLGRVCFSADISPEACELAIRRWEDMTGELAVTNERIDV
jgi:hypothetical protein